jgi:hypothetical protein
MMRGENDRLNRVYLRTTEYSYAVVWRHAATYAARE